MKSLVLIVATTLFIAGCANTVTKEISPTLRYVEVQDSKGNVVNKYYEMYEDGSWYEAENKNGKWQLSAKGVRDKEVAKDFADTSGPGDS